MVEISKSARFLAFSVTFLASTVYQKHNNDCSNSTKSAYSNTLQHVTVSIPCFSIHSVLKKNKARSLASPIFVLLLKNIQENQLDHLKHLPYFLYRLRNRNYSTPLCLDERSPVLGRLLNRRNFVCSNRILLLVV